MNRIVTLTSELIPALMPEKLSSLASSVLALLPSESPDPDATRTVPELIESRGFKAETYEIPTPDGFILVLHRIINPHAQKLGVKCKPILLGHGIAAHSGHWLINSDDGHLEPWPHVDKNQNESTAGQRETSNSNRSGSSAYSSLSSSSRELKRAKKRTGNNLGFVLANLGYVLTHLFLFIPVICRADRKGEKVKGYWRQREQLPLLLLTHILCYSC